MRSSLYNTTFGGISIARSPIQREKREREKQIEGRNKGPHAWRRSTAAAATAAARNQGFSARRVTALLPRLPLIGGLARRRRKVVQHPTPQQITLLSWGLALICVQVLPNRQPTIARLKFSNVYSFGLCASGAQPLMVFNCFN